VDHHAHFERSLETHSFIVLQAISLKIGTLDISGLLFLNLQLKLSYEVWIKVISISKLDFCQAGYIFVTFSPPAVRPPLGQDLSIHLVHI